MIHCATGQGVHLVRPSRTEVRADAADLLRTPDEPRPHLAWKGGRNDFNDSANRRQAPHVGVDVPMTAATTHRDPAAHSPEAVHPKALDAARIAGVGTAGNGALYTQQEGVDLFLIAHPKIRV